MSGVSPEQAAEPTLLGIVRQSVDWRVDYEEGGERLSVVFGYFDQVNQFVQAFLPVNERVYPVLTLMIDDAIALDEPETEEREGSNRYEAIYRSLIEADRQHVASYLLEWVWDGDAWDEALSCALNNLEAEKNGRAKPEAAR